MIHHTGSYSRHHSKCIVPKTWHYLEPISRLILFSMAGSEIPVVWPVRLLLALVLYPVLWANPPLFLLSWCVCVCMCINMLKHVNDTMEWEFITDTLKHILRTPKDNKTYLLILPLPRTLILLAAALFVLNNVLVPMKQTFEIFVVDGKICFTVMLDETLLNIVLADLDIKFILMLECRLGL